MLLEYYMQLPRRKRHSFHALTPICIQYHDNYDNYGYIIHLENLEIEHISAACFLIMIMCLEHPAW